MTYPKIYLKPKKEESVLRLHPWIFSGAVARIDGQPEEGAVVEVFATDGRLLGVGHYQIGSIAVRLLAFDEVTIDHAFWLDRLRSAYNLRQMLGLDHAPENDTYRLVYGEGDRLPGLVIDMYADTAVMQAHSVGMHHARHDIATALRELLGDRLQAIYYKSDGTLPFKAALDHTDEYLLGRYTGGEHLATERGLRFGIDWLKGQKTGFFVDQRENRRLLEQYAGGRTVLNMFCYTGGFSVYAMRGGARAVHSVDSSSKAVSLTERNVALNFPDDDRHRAFAEDAFDSLRRAGNDYDLLILDPPAFAKHRDVLRNALQRRGFREDSSRRHPLHLLLLASSQSQRLQTGRLHRRCTDASPRPHPASAHPTRRSSRQHLSPRRRIPQRPRLRSRIAHASHRDRENAPRRVARLPIARAASQLPAR